MLSQQLRSEVAVAADRSLCELREERNEQRKLEDIMLRLLLAAVDVYHIAERLEGIKRYAQRHYQVDRLELCRTRKDIVDSSDSEVCILGNAQDTEIEQQTKQQPSPAPAFHLVLICLLLLL